MSEDLFEKVIKSETTPISLLEKFWTIIFGGWEDMPELEMARIMLLEEVEVITELQEKKLKRAIYEDDDDEEDEE